MSSIITNLGKNTDNRLRFSLPFKSYITILVKTKTRVQNAHPH